MYVTKSKMSNEIALLKVRISADEVDQVFAFAAESCGFPIDMNMGDKAAEELLMRRAIEALMPKIVTEAKIRTAFPVNPPKGLILKRGKAISFDVQVVQAPRFELTGYEPIVIKHPVGMDREEVLRREMSAIEANVVPHIVEAWLDQSLRPNGSAAATLGRIASQFNDQEYLDKIFNCQTAIELGRRLKGSISLEACMSVCTSLHAQVRVLAEGEGVSHNEFIESVGGTVHFDELMLAQAQHSLALDYALDEIYRSKGLKVRDVDKERAGYSLGAHDPEFVKRRMEELGTTYMLDEAAERLCAADWMLASAVLQESPSLHWAAEPIEKTA